MQHILIVEDVLETSRWLEAIVLAAYPTASVAHAGNVKTALQQLGARPFELALIDLGLPDGSGFDILRQLPLLNPDTIGVVTTVLGDDAHVVMALSAGADGYLLKENPPELLTRQLYQLAQGQPALSPTIARRIMEHFRRTGPVGGSAEEALTPREQEVLALIGRGLRNKDVAQSLGLAESTIASYIKAIYRKLGISTRAEASWCATRLGLGER